MNIESSSNLNFMLNRGIIKGELKTFFIRGDCLLDNERRIIMEKESRNKIIRYCISLLLGITVTITHTTHIVLPILLIFILIIYFHNFIMIQKFYKELIETAESMKIYKHERWKSYFEYSGETLNNMIQSYDSIINSQKEIIEQTSEHLTKYDYFLSRRQKEKVNEIRESSRA